MSRPPCSGLWETPTVHVSGEMTTCCLDDHLLNRLGNLAETSFADLWFGETLHAWRLAQIEGRFEDSGPFCCDCDWLSAGTYTSEEIRRYLERTGEVEILERWERQSTPKP